MEARTETNTRSARGRKDSEGTQEIIKIKPIKDASADVMKLLRKAETAKAEANEAFKSLAERSGTNVSSLKKLFRSSLKGNFADVRNEVDQLSLLFEQVGEIQGGRETGE